MCRQCFDRLQTATATLNNSSRRFSGPSAPTHHPFVIKRPITCLLARVCLLFLRCAADGLFAAGFLWCGLASLPPFVCACKMLLGSCGSPGHREQSRWHTPAAERQQQCGSTGDTGGQRGQADVTSHAIAGHAKPGEQMGYAGVQQDGSVGRCCWIATHAFCLLMHLRRQQGAGPSTPGCPLLSTGRSNAASLEEPFCLLLVQAFSRTFGRGIAVQECTGMPDRD